ncbi:MAG: PAS domain S-box protein [Candidatus Binatia bacterium]
MAVDQEQLIGGLLQVAESLISDLPLEARLTDLCRTTVQLLGCDRSSIFLREGRYYRAKCNHGNPPDIAPRFPQFKVSLRDPLISRAMETRSFVLVNDAQDSPLMNAQTARRARIQSIVVAPLFDDRREPLGFITAEYNENFGVFTEAMSTLVLGVAKLAELVCVQHRHAAERQRAEEALRESEERFRALADQSITGIGVFQDDRFAYVNPRLAEVAGYQQDEMLRVPPIELVVETDRELFRENIRRRLSGEVPSAHYVFEVRRKDGTEIMVEVYGNRMTYNGRPAILSTVLDITERRQAEEAVMRERDFSEAVLNSLPGVFYVFDQNLKYLRWNKNVEQVLGYTGSEIARLSPLDLVAAEDKELLRTRIEEVFAKGASAVEVHLVAKDGTRTPYYLTGLTTRIDDKLCLIGMGIDITERKRAEEALRFVRFSVDSAPYTMVWVDRDAHFIDVNDAFCQVSGYSRDELLHMTVHDIDPQYAAAIWLEFWERLKQAGSLTFESMHRTKRGEIFSVEITANYLEYNGKEYHCALAHDITERKRAEANQQLVVDTLRLLNRPNDPNVLVEELVRLIKRSTGFEAVGLRLREGDDFPYFVATGFPEDFVRAERYLCARDQAGELVRDSTGNPVLECMCGNIICGRTDPVLPSFTEGGSFWTNSTTSLLATTTEADRQARTRNRCNGEGYESVALIPLRSGDEIIGLLQLNDRRPGRFTPESIPFYEGLAASIGVALKRGQAAEEIERTVREWQVTFDAVNDAIWILDADHRVLRSNKVTERFFHHPCRAMLGEHCWTIAHGATERHPDCPLERARRSGHRETMEVQQGEQWVEVIVDPIVDAAGQYVGAVYIVTDITERKRAAEQIKAQVDELQRWHEVMLGREDRVQQLKREVNELCRRMGETARYPSQEANSADSQAPAPKAPQ